MPAKFPETASVVGDSLHFARTAQPPEKSKLAQLQFCLSSSLPICGAPLSANGKLSSIPLFRWHAPNCAFAIYSFFSHVLLLHWLGMSSECNGLKERANCLGKRRTTLVVLVGRLFLVSSNNCIQARSNPRKTFKNQPFPLVFSSRPRESNPRPSLYESDALPTELGRR